MSTPRRYARIALPVPLGQAFTYRVPEGITVQNGARVLVELGRRKCLGVVIDQSCDLPPVPEDKIKEIVSIVDEEPSLPDELRQFLIELARYYLAPLGEVFRLALPALERKTAEELSRTAGKKLKAVGKMVQIASLKPRHEWSDGPLPRGNALSVLKYLEAKGPSEMSTLSASFSTARSIVKKLVALNVVTLEEHQKISDPFHAETLERDHPPQLNDAQQSAVAAICRQLDQHQSDRFLLDGVTASGKTEVYLHAAAHVLSQNRSVIFLVPEIALTPQLIFRLRARLGDEIAVLHSALSEGARLIMWQKLRAGELRVVVGARSALFAPVRDLGLVCVDEEHDGSYKQEEGVRYNARDMALLRAHRAGAVCVLGSATPSLASVYQVRQGKMQRLHLPDRAHHAAEMPEVELVDLNRHGPGPSGSRLLSLRLHRAIEDNLKQGGQTILFLNRRGFSPSLICEGCGAISECPHCSVALTLHRSGGPQLRCHYCDHSEAVPEQCKSCGSGSFVEEGVGTEKVEKLLQDAFPKARIARLDRDVGGGLKSEAIVARVREKKVDILVGTQMVTKGHDLPGVTLVGVLNADAALSLPDFRAAERTFHLLVQVAGRAGRADAVGKVLIQTRCPDHPAIAYAQKHDVPGFIAHELKQRQEVGYPPATHIALVRLSGMSDLEVAREARRISEIAESEHPQVQMLGPAPAPIARLRNRYRYRFMLRCETRAPLHEALLTIARTPVARRVRMTIDVDPVSML